MTDAEPDEEDDTEPEPDEDAVAPFARTRRLGRVDAHLWLRPEPAEHPRAVPAPLSPTVVPTRQALLAQLPERAPFQRRNKVVSLRCTSVADLVDQHGPTPLDHGDDRPRTRADCVDGPRPCPWISCRHSLFLDVLANGNIRHNFPGVEVEDMLVSCSLDVADEGEHTLQEVARVVSLTRERVRQIEARYLPVLRGEASLAAEGHNRRGGRT